MNLFFIVNVDVIGQTPLNHCVPLCEFFTLHFLITIVYIKASTSTTKRQKNKK